MDAQPTADLRPCAHCGRPVPQRAGAGRPFRYCRDNDGACLRASRNSRMRHRNAPGLPGQVARTWEAVDRLDQIVETLTEALHAELSPVGVERQLAQARADAAAEIAAAQTERDEALRAAEDATAAAVQAREQARAALAERDTARTDAERAAEQAGRDAERARQAEADRDEARGAATAARALRVQAERDRDAARQELRTVRAERDTERGRVADLTAERDAARADADRATRDAGAARENAQRWQTEVEDVRRQAEQARTDATRARAGAADAVRAREEADRARDRAETAARQADTARLEADTVAGHLRAELTAAATGREALADELATARRVAATAEGRLTELTVRLQAAEADRDAAQQRVAQLAGQVSDLAAALARLGSAAAAADTPAG
ncbi:coiled-coil domain-containing protein [Micromonospora musae]|uniref:Chromosome segregation ATPase n=1 Tax=Micromonospora musae TaxID=1894970 RepID=A0A3A9YGN1_9ACTN|nr:hypothetical protein [Micromonospora musae]RKN36210.1 hypothetical protein D7044_00675 [Micromonospora musae]